MLPLKVPAQNYAWGRPADRSEVAQLARSNGSEVDDSKPFAELWMGTHPSGPAVIAGGDTTLKQWVQDHPEALGEAVLQRFGGDLPFLFKVLSVQTALSIQSHPDKALAERLHASNPKDYKDNNHKPEMALALEDFEALCGFVEPAELREALKAHGELRLCVGEEQAAAVAAAGDADFKPALKAAFTALMTCDASKVASAINGLVGRLSEEQAGGRKLLPKEGLVLRLNQQYPGDVGVLSAFFLNLIALREGEAIYLAANEPHAYLSGELMEVMATSDNVIRAGLTPKFRDTQVLCESLTYVMGVPEVLRGQVVHDHVQAYRPPFDEFEIQLMDVPAGEEVRVAANPGPQLLLVQKGAGSAQAEGSGGASGSGLQRQAELHRGAVLFVAAGARLKFTAGAGAPLRIWAAACNARVFAGERAAEQQQQQEAAAAKVQEQPVAAMVS